MQFPLSTGAVCALVGLPEHRIRNFIRSGKLSVPCLGGRRMWFPNDVLALSKLVGRDTVELRNACRVAREAAVQHAKQEREEVVNADRN